MTDKEKAWRERNYRENIKPAYDSWIKLYPFTTVNLDDEQWKDIKGYGGDYQISNYGRIKSFKRNKINIIRPLISRRGYLMVVLCNNGKEKNVLIHRLVAEHFVPNPSNLPEVDHVFGMKFDNFAGNLRWVTSSQNVKNSYSNGRNKLHGEKNPHSRLTNEQVEYIRINPDNLTLAQLAQMFDMTSTPISLIQRGKSYKNAGGEPREKLLKPQNRYPDELREKIRAEYKAGIHGCDCRSLAKKYGVHPSTVCNILHEK